MKKLFLLLSLTLLVSFVNAQTAGENIDVTHYEIHLSDFDFTSHTFMGYAYVTVTTTAPTDTFVLELKGLNATYVSSDGYSVNHFSQEGDLLVIVLDIPAPAGSTMTLYISYGGSTFNESWGGVHWWGDKVYNLGVGFDSQPHNLGKTWFPCVDDFTDKATYDLFITATNDKKAVCGGNLVETIDNGDGTTTWHWNTPQEVATYHISFIVAELDLWEDTYHGIERDIPIEVYTIPSLSNKVENTFVHIKEIAAFFEEHLGPYPFNRIGYVSTSLGCMEHTDNIALATSVISGNTDNEEYLAHELSHMWSGNLVTCAEAGDMWLNEGFAQFWGTFYVAGVYGEQKFQTAISNKVEQIISWCNIPNNWMPLNNIPLNMTYDNKAVYERGAVIVNTMMNYMGRENFLSAMRQYFSQYAYQAATSAQLCEALTQYSGIDMQGFFDSYVYASGMPHLYAVIESVTPVGNQYEVSLKLSYQHIGDTHIGQNNKYEVTFIGSDFQLVTEKLTWDGLHGNATITLDFEPVAVVNDFNNNWLDGKRQKNFMLKNSNDATIGDLILKATALTDSVFVAVEDHFVGPYDDPLVEALTLSSKHFWTVSRHDFGKATVRGSFYYSKTGDSDIIQTKNDSVTLLYRKDASEPWHEVAFTLEPGSTWKVGFMHVEDLLSGEYTLASWDKTILGLGEWIEMENGMQVFPNPAENQVNVRWQGKVSGQLVLTDLNGRVLKCFAVDDTDSIQFSTDGLATGSYQLSRTDANGTILEIKQIVIK